METEYKILLLEESETDAELIMDQVLMSGFKFIFKRVANEDNFKEKVSNFKPHLILSAYSLSAYNGIDALKYILGKHPDIPVIIVTSSINEETAVACMRTGAVDYVLKDRMSRLGLAVRTALEKKDIIIERERVKKELIKSKLYYRNILKYMHDGIVVISKDYIITDINNSVLKITGNARDDIIGQPCYKVLHNIDSPCSEHGINCYLSKVINSGKSERYQRTSKIEDEKETQLDIIISPLFDENKKITHVIESYRDITDLKEAQDEIKKLSTVVEQSPNPIIILDNEGIINYVNPSFVNLTGYNSDDIIGKLLETISAEGITKEEHKLVLKGSLNGDIKEKIFKNRKKDGEIFYSSSRFARYKDSFDKIKGLIVVMNDITQSIYDQKQIENALKEKELLLQEIYHRVNNNMQIMISLFNMQIQRTDIQSEKNILIYAMSRVGSMSAIHSAIYQERSFVAINFANVTRHIFNTLCDSLMVFCGNFELKVEAEIPDFGLDLAQPCALIVNELISNSIRHAYPDGKGLIYVSLTINEADELTLLVKDNGVGIPESIEPESSDSTGFSLVHLLGKGQLDGTVGFNNDNGTTVTIKFKKIEDHKRF